MPYRRLPTTDRARLRALESALKKFDNRGSSNLALSDAYIDELKLVKTRFQNTLTQYELDVKIQSDRNRLYKKSMESARMYLSHFIQVLFLTSERGEINGGISYYELKDFSGKVPQLTTEKEILQWGNKIVDGEQKRMQNGGSAIYNPSIALVKIKVETFKDAAIFQSNLKRNASRSYEKMMTVRKSTNNFISRMWTEIEENIISDDVNEKRSTAQEYGIVYIYRRKEKREMEPKNLQQDLFLNFG